MRPEPKSRILAVLLVAGSAACIDGATGLINQPPSVDVGADFAAALLETVTLTGSGSDPDGDALTYTWALTSRPSGSTAELSSTNTAETSFMPDEAGAFVAELTVSDGTDTAKDDVTITVALGACDDPVDLFPVPVTSSTSPFPSVDDSFLEVPFRGTFSFSFYGTEYGSVFLNTNGGVTFGAGNDDYDEAASSITQPGIAVFWGDMDAKEYGGEERADQMAYQACDDVFTVTYLQHQDNDEETWNNTATLYLFPNGRVVIEYGEVLSEDILAGVFDGTHTDDRYLSIQGEYPDYFSSGTGIILMDYWGDGSTHSGELTDQRIIFDPSPASSLAAPAARSVQPITGGPSRVEKGPKDGRLRR